MDRLYSIAQVAAIVGMSRKRVQRAIDRGLLRSLSIEVPRDDDAGTTRVTRIAASAIEDWCGVRPSAPKHSPRKVESIAAKHGILLGDSDGWW